MKPVYGYLMFEHAGVRPARKMEITTMTFTIGLDATNDLRVLDKEVQETHLKIEVRPKTDDKYDGYDYAVRTMPGATIKVNQKEVLPDEEIALLSKDVITVAERNFIFTTNDVHRISREIRDFENELNALSTPKSKANAENLNIDSAKKVRGHLFPSFMRSTAKKRPSAANGASVRRSSRRSSTLYPVPLPTSADNTTASTTAASFVTAFSDTVLLSSTVDATMTDSTSANDTVVERANGLSTINEKSKETSVFSTPNAKEATFSEQSPSFVLLEGFPKQTPPKPPASSLRPALKTPLASASVSKQSKSVKFNAFSEQKLMTKTDKKLAEGKQLIRTKLFDGTKLEEEEEVPEDDLINAHCTPMKATTPKKSPIVARKSPASKSHIPVLTPKRTYSRQNTPVTIRANTPAKTPPANLITARKSPARTPVVAKSTSTSMIAPRMKTPISARKTPAASKTPKIVASISALSDIEPPLPTETVELVVEETANAPLAHSESAVDVVETEASVVDSTAQLDAGSQAELVVPSESPKANNDANLSDKKMPRQNGSTPKADYESNVDFGLKKLMQPETPQPNYGANTTGIGKMMFQQEGSPPKADYESTVDFAVGHMFREQQSEPASGYDANLTGIGKLMFQQEGSSPKADYESNVDFGLKKLVQPLTPEPNYGANLTGIGKMMFQQEGSPPKADYVSNVDFALKKLTEPGTPQPDYGANTTGIGKMMFQQEGSSPKADYESNVDFGLKKLVQPPTPEPDYGANLTGIGKMMFQQEGSTPKADYVSNVDFGLKKLTEPGTPQPDYGANTTGIGKMMFQQEGSSPKADYESNVDFGLKKLVQPPTPEADYGANLTGIGKLMFQQEGSSPKANYSLNVSTVSQLFHEEEMKPAEVNVREEPTPMAPTTSAAFETPKMTRSSKRIATSLRQTPARIAKSARLEASTPKTTVTRSVRKAAKPVEEVVDEVDKEEKLAEVDIGEELKPKSKRGRKAVATTTDEVPSSEPVMPAPKGRGARAKVQVDEGKSEDIPEIKEITKRTRKRVFVEEEEEEENEKELADDSKAKVATKRRGRKANVEDEPAVSAKKPAAPKRTRGRKVVKTTANVEVESESEEVAPEVSTRKRGCRRVARDELEELAGFSDSESRREMEKVIDNAEKAAKKVARTENLQAPTTRGRGARKKMLEEERLGKLDVLDDAEDILSTIDEVAVESKQRTTRARAVKKTTVKEPAPKKATRRKVAKNDDQVPETSEAASGPSSESSNQQHSSDDESTTTSKNNRTAASRAAKRPKIILPKRELSTGVIYSNDEQVNANMEKGRGRITRSRRY